MKNILSIFVRSWSGNKEKGQAPRDQCETLCITFPRVNETVHSFFECYFGATPICLKSQLLKLLKKNWFNFLKVKLSKDFGVQSKHRIWHIGVSLLKQCHIRLFLPSSFPRNRTKNSQSFQMAKKSRSSLHVCFAKSILKNFLTHKIGKYPRFVIWGFWYFSHLNTQEIDNWQKVGKNQKCSVSTFCRQWSSQKTFCLRAEVIGRNLVSPYIAKGKIGKFSGLS